MEVTEHADAAVNGTLSRLQRAWIDSDVDFEPDIDKLRRYKLRMVCGIDPQKERRVQLRVSAFRVRFHNL